MLPVLLMWKNHKDFFCQELCGAWTAWIFPVWFFILCGQSSTGGERISFFYGMQWFVFVCSVEKKRDHPGIFKTAEPFYSLCFKKRGTDGRGNGFFGHRKPVKRTFFRFACVSGRKKVPAEPFARGSIPAYPIPYGGWEKWIFPGLLHG